MGGGGGRAARALGQGAGLSSGPLALFGWPGGRLGRPPGQPNPAAPQGRLEARPRQRPACGKPSWGYKRRSPGRLPSNLAACEKPASQGSPAWLPGRVLSAREPWKPRKSGAGHFFDKLRGRPIGRPQIRWHLSGVTFPGGVRRSARCWWRRLCAPGRRSTRGSSRWDW